MKRKTNNLQSQKTSNVYSMVQVALFAAVTCVLAPFSIPIGPVPLSLTTLVLYVSIYVLGWRRALVSYTVYLCLGMVGLPVFSGFEGGIGKLAGPTGGYLIGFLFMIPICGLLIAVLNRRMPERGIVSGKYSAGGIVSMILGTAVMYAFGTAWFCISTGTGPAAALAVCVFPFVIGDLLKIIAASLAGPAIERQLRQNIVSYSSR